MLTNKSFDLSEEQLQRFDEWSSAMTKAMFDADIGESAHVYVTFTFSAIGRSVEAVYGGTTLKLVLEDAVG